MNAKANQINPAPAAGRRHLHRSGVALVVVLSFVVLLSVVVVAYFSRVLNTRQVANDSFNGSRTDQLARNALDVIVNDFKQEIANGSTPTTVNGVTTYYPAKADGTIQRANMVPMRSGTNDAIPNLVRRSFRDDGPAGAKPMPTPGVSSRASAVGSGDASTNGRVVSLVRWNKHLLVPSKSTATVTDATPDANVNFTAPDWVLVTRNGPAVQTTVGSGAGALNDASPANGNFVVGRYAYAVYDEGGLLDANVAGYPTGMTPAQIGAKNAPALADLTRIPIKANPVTYPTDYLSQTGVIDQLLGWRSYATARPSGGFGSFGFDNNSAGRYYDSLAQESSGFLRANATKYYLNRTDQKFLSRGQLLSFQQSLQQKTPGAFPASVLQYLGTFARELNAPSWGPTQNATDLGGTSTDTNKRPANYKDNRDKDTVTGTTPLQPVYNRLLPGVRYANGGTITSYRADGTAFTYNVNAGDPLVQRRFPLGRLAWVGANAPSADMAPKIKACFGLTWNAGSNSWQYDAALASQYIAPNTAYNDVLQVRYAIKSLGEVAKEKPPREPNFFELLEAGMLSGSLAMPAHDRSSASGGHSASAYSFNVSADTWPDYHVFRVGASIISQAQTPDAVTGSCYPCAITYTRNGQAVQLCGIDDLPYLNMFNMLPGKDPTTFPDPKTAGVMVDVVFGLWNPSRSPDPVASVRARPPVRLCVQGEVMLRNEYGNYGYESVKSPVNNTKYTGTIYNIGSETASGTARVELLAGTDGKGVNAFLDPHVVRANDIVQPTPAIDAGTPNGKQWAVMPSIQGQLAGETYVGYRLPDFFYDPTLPYDSTRHPSASATPYGTLDWAWLQCVYNSNSIAYPFNAWLEYKSPGGVWVPYNDLGGYDPLSGWTKSFGAFMAYMCTIATATPTPTAKPQVMDVPPGLTFSDTNYYTRYPQTSIDPRAGRFHFAQGQTPLSANSANLYADWPKYLRTSIWSSATEATKGSAAPTAGLPLVGRAAFQNTPSVFFPNGYTWANPLSWTPLGLARNSLSNYESVGASDARFLPAYTDPDGVQRIADSGLYSYDPAIAAANGWRGNPYALIDRPPSVPGDRVSDVTNEVATDRPFILHRPFNNVGELGYVSRDCPWRTLDFFTDKSADAGLLDLFTANANSESLNAGRINLNTRNAVALHAALSGTLPNLLANRTTSADKIKNLATKLAALTNPANTAANAGPLIGKDEVATRFVPSLSVPTPNSSYPAAVPADFDNTDDQNIKGRREAVTRAFSEIGQTRTWNLLIDVVAQSGRYSPDAKTLSQFNVEGERHYWLHVAIDRFTGEVIDQQLEAVTE